MNNRSVVPDVARAVLQSTPEPSLAVPFVHDLWWNEKSFRQNLGDERAGRTARTFVHDKWWVDGTVQSAVPGIMCSAGARPCCRPLL